MDAERVVATAAVMVARLVASKDCCWAALLAEKKVGSLVEYWAEWRAFEGAVKMVALLVDKMAEL